MPIKIGANVVIRFRAIEESDLPQLRDWRNGDKLRSWAREYRLLNLVNQRDWFEHISRSCEVEMFGIEYLANSGFELVGVCGLCNINWVYRTAEPSIYVAPDLRDTNIAARALDLLRQKAFEELNLRRLWTEVYDFHPARIALHEGGGYVLEGRLRKHVFKLGKYRDSLVFGLLREDGGGE